MSYFDDSIPTDTEAVKRGAERIRGVKTALNTVLGKVFTDAGNFLTKWVTTSQVADGAIGATQLAADAVTAAKLAADAVETAAVKDGAITLAKLAANVSRIAIGAYAGGAASVVVTGLGFAPDVVLIARQGVSAFGVAFRVEAGPIHPGWSVESGGGFGGGTVGPFTLTGSYLTALTWQSGGFTVVPAGWMFNQSGANYTVVALKA